MRASFCHQDSLARSHVLVHLISNNARHASAQACSNRRASFCPDSVVKQVSQFLQWLGAKFGRPVAAPAFAKPALTYEQQVQLLRSRGLVIADEPAARHCLAHHNYYRLSAYRYPFSEPADSHRFLPGTTFEQLWALYC